MNDIVLTPDYDLLVENGDFALADTLNQQIACLLESRKGDYRQYPDLGIGLCDYLLDDQINALQREAAVQLRRDGLRLTKLQNRNGQIWIQAQRAET